MFAASFWLIYQCLSGAIFLFSHLPPQWVHLERLLVVLGWFSRLLIFPRRLLRHLWPAETTPSSVLWLLATLNWVFWGVLAGLIRWRRINDTNARNR